MNLNLKIKQENTFDAIVVGSGISGGWAAKELCEKGLKTIVLEKGRNIKHVDDYVTAFQAPWDQPHRGHETQEEKAAYYVQSRTGQFTEFSKHLWANDKENPYTEVKPFDWIRGYHVGGRSLMWGRQSYRWSDLDFEANAKDGIAVDWPVRYKDIEPWYDYVESHVGISGRAEGLPQLPDSKFLPPMDFYCLEEHVKAGIEKHFSDRMMTIGRVANLTQPHKGRSNCQYRNLCRRGCPYGAYFSTQSSTLPAAEATGNLTLRPHSTVNSIIWDEEKNKAVGVRVIDTETNELIEYYSKVIFLCASTLGSTFILMNSTSDRFPNGFGNESDQLGRNLMDHHFRLGASGQYDGFTDKYYYGRRPNGIYIPRFRNLDKKTQQKDYIRGFGYQGGARRAGWNRGNNMKGLGAEFKQALTEPGPWSMSLTGFGECLPYEDNRITLNKDKTDKLGQPSLNIDCEWKENEAAMKEDMVNSAGEMLEAAGLKNVSLRTAWSTPGLGIHEMGTARMGKDPKTSVLNKWNQVWDAPNVFVTDGSFMSSASCVNPSLTYMAFTARAVDYAVQELKKQNL